MVQVLCASGQFMKDKYQSNQDIMLRLRPLIDDALRPPFHSANPAGWPRHPLRPSVHGWKSWWWAPLQASMPMRQGGSFAISSSSLARDTSGRTSVDFPAAFTPCTAKTFLARSIPTVTIVMISPSVTLMKRIHFPSCHLTAIQRKYCCTWHARDGEVPFIR